jgi:CubicO group peptidase (beta-lactamase class C family)
VVLVARDGKPVFLRAYGAADRTRKIMANEDTAYNVASIGKKFTQVAIAKLVQEGKLKRTATVGEILPDYPNAVSRAATVDQLLTMKGGIADFFGPGFDKVDKAKLNSNHAYYSYVSKLPPRFAPGAKNEYCNGCYVVLGEIVERVSGMPFETFVARSVFAPGGMTHSGYFNSASPPANTAVRYGRPRGPGTAYEDMGPFHGATGSGAGGVYASAKDLLAFDEALRAGRLLDAATTGWVLNAQAVQGRNPAPMGIAGGAPGTNAVLESGGRWTVIVTANVDPPVAERMGIAIARALGR